jgi:hypothetical protein
MAFLPFYFSHAQHTSIWTLLSMMEKCVGRIFFRKGKKIEEYGLKKIFGKNINKEDFTISHR